MCAQQVERATKRYRLRAAWLAWRTVYGRLVDLRPRLESFLARQAFKRVCKFLHLAEGTNLGVSILSPTWLW